MSYRDATLFTGETYMSVQQTLIIIKPDGLVKSLTGNILSRLAEAKLTIMGAKVVRVTRQ